MSPIVRNENSHAVYPANKRELRLQRGEVREVNGDDADAILALSGVVELDGDEGREALDAYRAEAGPITTGQSSSSRLEQAVSETTRAATLAGTSAPLQRVIGDDQAPKGPPTGTVSTKAIEAAKDPVSREAFGDNEALPGERVKTPQVPSPTGAPTGSDAHDQQVRNSEVVDDVARILAGDGDGDVDLEKVGEGLADDDDASDDGDVERDDAGNRTYEDVKGDDLDKLAAEREIEGRSSLKADEVRAALREQDAKTTA